MDRHLIFSIITATLFGAAASSSISAAEVTVTYPVGGLCVSGCPAEDFPATADGALRAEVTVTSVAIPCAGSGEPTDGVEEYAAGASGLHNLGGGNYQLNWATSKGYAGTCRQVRLDLGERNPDGTVFYRTADFQFTR